MSVDTNIPQVAALKKAVEARMGRPMITHADFVKLVKDIESAIGSHTSESTFERLWSYSTRSCASISISILDILSNYVGFRNWNDFLANSPSLSAKESEEILPADAIDAADLSEGDVVKMGWMPDRLMTVRCIGKCRFEVVEVANTGISIGDTFSALLFQKGRELFLDKYLDSTGVEHRYVVGKKNGLTLLELIKKDC